MSDEVITAEIDEAPDAEMYELEISPRHKEMALRIVSGQSQAEIARRMGVSPGFVSRVNQDPAFKAEVLRLMKRREDMIIKDSVNQVFADAAPGLAEALIGMALGADDERVRLAAIKDGLDRAGYGAVQKSASIKATFSADTAAMDRKELLAMLKTRFGRFFANMEQTEAERREAALIQVVEMREQA